MSGLTVEATAARSHAREHLIERFLRHVETTDGCWLWTGYRDKLGYDRKKKDGTRACSVCARERERLRAIARREARHAAKLERSQAA